MTHYVAKLGRDEKDLVSVEEVVYYDEVGDEVVDQIATTACMGIDTCFNTNYLNDPAQLLNRIKAALKTAGIKFTQLDLEEE